MQVGKGVRGMGRVGACLAFASSTLMLAGPTPALARDVKAAQQDSSFSVQLTGQQSVTGGDLDGHGSARLDLDLERGTACYEITWENLDGMVTAFHLHKARRGSDGPHWIDFFNNKNFPGEKNTVSECVNSTRENIEAVMKNPSDFYLNVHSIAFDKGAVRGQLG